MCSFYKEFPHNFFFQGNPLQIFSYSFYKGIHLQIDWGPPAENFTKEFPLILIWVHFTKKSLRFFFYREILCKNVPNFKT